MLKTVQRERPAAAVELNAKVLSESHFGNDGTQLLLTALERIDVGDAECLNKGLNKQAIQYSVSEALFKIVLAKDRTCDSELYAVLCAQRVDHL
eukprot:COSAG06_NODE_47301_length_340_cov_0.755187_1_plen_93_part_01